MKQIKKLEAEKAKLEKAIKDLKQEQRGLDLEKAQVDFDKFCNKLDKRHKVIAEFLWGELGWGFDTIKKFFKENKQDLNKRFFINIYWEHCDGQNMVDEKELLETIIDKVRSGYDDGFSMTIHDTKTGKTYGPEEIVDIKLKIDLPT
jgi:hypothetical protein